MITLRDIIGNIKKGQSALNVRAILNELERNYQQLLPSISIIGCKTNGQSEVTVYMTMSSISTKDALYDVVILANTQTKMDLDTKLKVYSNSPSFAYNFVYVFNKNGGLLFPEKFRPEFKTMQPKMRNPYETVGFDKYVFSGIRYMSDYKIPRIIGEFGGQVPDIKNFEEKRNEIGGIRELLKRERARLRR